MPPARALKAGPEWPSAEGEAIPHFHVENEHEYGRAERVDEQRAALPAPLRSAKVGCRGPTQAKRVGLGSRKRNRCS